MSATGSSNSYSEHFEVSILQKKSSMIVWPSYLMIDFVATFIVFFAVIDPVGTVPVFNSGDPRL